MQRIVAALPHCFVTDLIGLLPWKAKGCPLHRGADKGRTANAVERASYRWHGNHAFKEGQQVEVHLLPLAIRPPALQVADLAGSGIVGGF